MNSLFRFLFVCLFSLFPFQGLFSQDNISTRAKYFIAIKKNDGSFLQNLDEYFSFLPPRNHFYADPMLIKYNDVNYLFYEDYDYEKGVISCVTIDEDLNLSKPIKALELDIHLSFPFLFREDDKIYMIPETHQRNEIALYESIEFPIKWVKRKVFVNGSNYSDSILFNQNGYYWLITSDNNDILRIFYAENLFDEFMPHPINIERIKGRNAGGVFFMGGALIRPVMDCRPIYGRSMILKEIVLLTPTEFIERPIANIEPSWAPGLDGTHTFSINEDFIIYDGRRRISVLEDALYSSFE